jgi:ribosomal protein S18 acetylase RimI-like enzyme
MNGNLKKRTKLLSLSARSYDSEQDLIDMQSLLMEARSQTDDWRYAHVGELIFNFFMIASHLDPHKHIRLWYDAGKLVGFAMLGEDPSLDWQVLPAYEWCGIEDQAMAWGENLVAELRRGDLKKWGGAIVSGARQDNHQRFAFLEQHGFHPGGEFSEVNMLRSLDEPIPDSVIPAGYEIRSMSGEDIARRAEIQHEVWQPWTVGNVSEKDYACFMQLPGYQRDLDIIALTSDGAIVSYVNCWIDPVNKIGDFGPVGASPAHRRKGLTRAVLLEGLRRMHTYGMERVCVSTGISNIPAKNLYESIGFRTVNQYIEFLKKNDEGKEDKND